MKAISKADLLKLIDEALPDDATVVIMSSMLGEAFEINRSSINEFFTTVSDVSDDDVDFANASHVMVGA